MTTLLTAWDVQQAARGSFVVAHQLSLLPLRNTSTESFRPPPNADFATTHLTDSALTTLRSHDTPLTRHSALTTLLSHDTPHPRHSTLLFATMAKTKKRSQPVTDEQGSSSTVRDPLSLNAANNRIRKDYESTWFTAEEMEELMSRMSEMLEEKKSEGRMEVEWKTTTEAAEFVQENSGPGLQARLQEVLGQEKQTAA
ncbi:unnamed protein product [Zymoseptoria tritici ST99CH_1E4]|uniref:Uncharacterized protein n=1 Tax=Zymoseptoria tritici ST99CH_1E4 TaxID=1276532 RepID=A0A2H1H949_ZYMTR|nr:unnamed protein product [Zymoseptoria tritici ST99CH_1E4]